jgi:hypothetical protein
MGNCFHQYTTLPFMRTSFGYGGERMTCNFSPDINGTPYSADRSGPGYSNIIQSSNFKNCHLIAALSSLAWINNDFFSTNKNQARIFSKILDEKNKIIGYSYKFWNKDTNSYISPVNVNLDIFMDDKVIAKDQSNWCGAKSLLLESWPAMYEKAFAKYCLYKFKQYLTLDDLKNKDVNPEFGKLPLGSDWGGNPVNDLYYLTGSSLKPFPIYTTDKKFDITTIYAYIKSLCNPLVMGRAIATGVTNGSKTKYPMGAWTYKDEAAALEKTGIKITYDTATIVADHCYSILGVYENGGSQYIIMRNPFGYKDPDPGSYPVGKGTWVFMNTRSVIGNIVTTADLKADKLDLGLSDGIFAFDAKEFVNYFEGFGHIAT